MNESSIKTKIYLIKFTDMLLFLGVFGWGIYATINAQNRPMAALLALLGLGVVNMYGRWTFTQVARLQSELREIERLKPKF